MKKKLAVYPYAEEFHHFEKYSDLISEYEPYSLVMPKGRSVAEEEKNWAGFSKNYNVSSESDNPESCTCDYVLFTDSNNGNSDKIQQALSVEKQVLRFAKHTIDDAIRDAITPEKIMKRINAPVMMIFGQGEHTQKFDIQLDLRARFLKDGYNVLSFGTKDYAEIFGMETFPDCCAFPLWKKILFLNDYAFERVREFKPDVIIIGTPGGIMPANDRNVQFFGEDALALSTAIVPDISIMSIYENLAVDGLVTKMKMYMRYRMGVEFDILHVSNMRMIQEDIKKPTYFRVDKEQVVNRIKNLTAEQLTYNCADDQQNMSIYSSVIEILLRNVPVV